jgi:AAHS family 4-hydroxybenzoate transporter-like MFS transporter
MDTNPREVDVSELLENRRMGAFQWLTLILGCLILFVDGLDFSAANVGAPAILRAFSAEKSAMGFVFSAGFVGILIGSLLFGYIGDKYGRKVGAIAGVLAYSIPAVLTIFATSLDQLALFRFLSGLGMGGVVPNVIALLTETAPKRYRITFVMVAYVGYSLGNAAVAQVAAWFIPSQGWPVVFLAAGIAGIGLSALLVFLLPESIPYLAATRPQSPELPKLVRRAAPERAFDANTRFVLHRPKSQQKFALKLLFTEERRIATPLLWLGFFAESLTYMTFSAWFSVLLEQAGLMPTQAALTFSLAYLAAIVAILVLARMLDMFGPKATVVSATAGIAAFLYLGTPGLSVAAITLTAILAMACSSSTHQALNGIVGGFYPTIIRGNGVGYASGMGRAAAIIGPAIAGYLLSARLPLQAVLAIIVSPYVVVIGVCLALSRLKNSMAAASAAEQTESVSAQWKTATST